VSDLSVGLWAGILLGLGFLFSTFTAIIVGGAVGLLYAVRLVQQRSLGSLVQCAVLGAAPVAVGIGISAALGYTDPADGMLFQFGINPVALRSWRYVMLLSPVRCSSRFRGPLRPRWLLNAGAAAAALIISALVFISRRTCRTWRRLGGLGGTPDADCVQHHRRWRSASPGSARCCACLSSPSFC
jgi:hypothetical protein